MIKDILALAEEFEKSVNKTVGIKTAGKQRLSRGRISKTLDKAKVDYSKLKGNLDSLEANDAKLRTQLDGTRKEVQDARKKIMQMHGAMKNMDLSNANDAVFYDGQSADDIGYIINGKEYHLDIDDSGEVSLTPMNKHRKANKPPKKEEEQCADDNCSDDTHEHAVTEDEDVASAAAPP